MSYIIEIHPDNPHKRSISKVVSVLNTGGIIAYPTDSGFALGCTLGNKNAMEKIIKIRHLKKHHHFTLMMKDLSDVGEYAKLNNVGFRLMKKILPGPYTFILEGAKFIPNRLLSTKKKTIGIRVSGNKVVQSLLEDLDEPIMSVSLIIEGYDFYNCNDVKAVLNGEVDVIIDSGHCPPEPTTVLDISENDIVILRKGAGSLNFVN